MRISVKTFLMLFVLGTCWTAVYSLPFIQYLLYDPFREAIGCSNAQLGLLMTIFGLGNIFGAPLGGWLADRFDYRKIYVGSLLVCGVLAIYFASAISYSNALIVWVGLAVGVLVMNYPSHIKIVRMLASDSDQGKIFGLNESFGGAASIIVNAILLFVFARFAKQLWGMRAVVYIIGALCLVCAVICIFMLKNVGKTVENGAVKEDDEPRMTGKEFVSIIKNPATWIIGFSIFAVYSFVVSMSYFTPYFTAVIGGTVAVSGLISLVRTYGLRLVGAPLGGYLADKFKSVSKLLIVIFVIGILILTVFLSMVSYLSTGIFILLTLIVGTIVYMGKGCYYALVTELHVSRAHSASTIGVAAALGFSPDVFMFALAGHWIDKYGNTGYRYLFLFQLIILVIGILGSIFALAYKKKYHSEKEEEN